MYMKNFHSTIIAFNFLNDFFFQIKKDKRVEKSHAKLPSRATTANKKKKETKSQIFF